MSRSRAATFSLYILVALFLPLSFAHAVGKAADLACIPNSDQVNKPGGYCGETVEEGGKKKVNLYGCPCSDSFVKGACSVGGKTDEYLCKGTQCFSDGKWGACGLLSEDQLKAGTQTTPQPSASGVTNPDGTPAVGPGSSVLQSALQSLQSPPTAQSGTLSSDQAASPWTDTNSAKNFSDFVQQQAQSAPPSADTSLGATLQRWSATVFGGGGAQTLTPIDSSGQTIGESVQVQSFNSGATGFQGTGVSGQNSNDFWSGVAKDVQGWTGDVLRLAAQSVPDIQLTLQGTVDQLTQAWNATVGNPSLSTINNSIGSQLLDAQAQYKALISTEPPAPASVSISQYSNLSPQSTLELANEIYQNQVGPLQERVTQDQALVTSVGTKLQQLQTAYDNTLATGNATLNNFNKSIAPELNATQALYQQSVDNLLKPDQAQLTQAAAEYNALVAQYQNASPEAKAADVAQQVKVASEVAAYQASVNADTLSATRDRVTANTHTGVGLSADCWGVCQKVDAPTLGGTESIPLSAYNKQLDAQIADAQAQARTLDARADFFNSNDPLATKIAQTMAEGGPRAAVVASDLDQMLAARSQIGQFYAPSDAPQIAADKADALERLTSGGDLTPAERIAIYPSTMPSSAIDAQIARDTLTSSNLSSVLPSLVSVRDAVSLFNSPTPEQWQQMSTMSDAQLSDYKTAAVVQAGVAATIDVATLAGFTPPGARLFGAAFEAVTPAFVSSTIGRVADTALAGLDAVAPATADVLREWSAMAGTSAPGAAGTSGASGAFEPSFASDLSNAGTRVATPYIQQEQAYFAASVARGTDPVAAEAAAYQNLYQNLARTDLSGAMREEVLTGLQQEMNAKGIELPAVTNSTPAVHQSVVSDISPIPENRAAVPFEPGAAPVAEPAVAVGSVKQTPSVPEPSVVSEPRAVSPTSPAESPVPVVAEKLPTPQTSVAENVPVQEKSPSAVPSESTPPISPENAAPVAETPKSSELPTASVQDNTPSVTPKVSGFASAARAAAIAASLGAGVVPIPAFAPDGLSAFADTAQARAIAASPGTHTVTASVYGYGNGSGDGANQLLADGTRLGANPYTAASLTYPLGTRLRVTNPSNGKSVVVQVRDRGPYVAGRQLDVARGAAQALGLDVSVYRLQIEVVPSTLALGPTTVVNPVVAAIDKAATGFLKSAAELSGAIPSPSASQPAAKPVTPQKTAPTTVVAQTGPVPPQTNVNLRAPISDVLASFAPAPSPLPQPNITVAFNPSFAGEAGVTSPFPNLSSESIGKSVPSTAVAQNTAPEPALPVVVAEAPPSSAHPTVPIDNTPPVSALTQPASNPDFATTRGLQLVSNSSPSTAEPPITAEEIVKALTTAPKTTAAPQPTEVQGTAVPTVVTPQITINNISSALGRYSPPLPEGSLPKITVNFGPTPAVAQLPITSPLGPVTPGDIAKAFPPTPVETAPTVAAQPAAPSAGPQTKPPTVAQTTPPAPTKTATAPVPSTQKPAVVVAKNTSASKAPLTLSTKSRPVVDLRSSQQIADEITALQKKADQLQAQGVEAQKALPAAQAKLLAANKISTNITSADGKVAIARGGPPALRNAVKNWGATEAETTAIANAVEAAKALSGELAAIPGGDAYVEKVQSYLGKAAALKASPSADGANATASAGDTLVSEVSGFLQKARAANKPGLDAAQTEVVNLQNQITGANQVLAQIKSLQGAKNAVEIAEGQEKVYQAEAQKAVVEAQTRINEMDAQVAACLSGEGECLAPSLESASLTPAPAPQKNFIDEVVATLDEAIFGTTPERIITAEDITVGGSETVQPNIATAQWNPQVNGITVSPNSSPNGWSPGPLTIAQKDAAIGRVVAGIDANAPESKLPVAITEAVPAQASTVPIDNTPPQSALTQPASAPAQNPAPTPPTTATPQIPIGTRPREAGGVSAPKSTNVENSVPPPAPETPAIQDNGVNPARQNTDIGFVKNADGLFELTGIHTNAANDNVLAASQPAPNSNAVNASNPSPVAQVPSAVNDNVPAWYREWVALMKSAQESVLTAFGEAPKIPAPQVAINPVPVTPASNPLANTPPATTPAPQATASEMVARSAQTRAAANPTELGTSYELLEAPSALAIRVVDTPPVDGVPVVLRNLNAPDNVRVTVGANDLASIGGQNALLNYVENNATRGLVSGFDKDALDLMRVSGFPPESITFYPLPTQPTRSIGLLERFNNWLAGPGTQSFSGGTPAPYTVLGGGGGGGTGGGGAGGPGTPPATPPGSGWSGGSSGGSSGGGSGWGGAWTGLKVTGGVVAIGGIRDFVNLFLPASAPANSNTPTVASPGSTKPASATPPASITAPPAPDNTQQKPPDAQTSPTTQQPPVVQTPPAQTPPKAQELPAKEAPAAQTVPPKAVTIAEPVPSPAPTGGGTSGSPVSGGGGSSIGRALGGMLGGLMKFLGIGQPQPAAPAQTAPVAPTVNLTASPTSIATGKTALLSWSGTGVSVCVLVDGNGMQLAQGTSAGSTSTPPLKQTSTFTVSCSSAAGERAISRTTVTVQ